MVDRNSLCKIGIGAWGIGGYAEKNPKNNDKRQIKAIARSLKRGQNLVEINFWNSQGKSVELIKKAIDQTGVNRKSLFLV